METLKDPIIEDERCCPDPAEPFPDFSISAVEELDKMFPPSYEISPICLARLTYGEMDLDPPEQTYAFKDLIDARTEVTKNFLREFNIKIKTK